MSLLDGSLVTESLHHLEKTQRLEGHIQLTTAGAVATSTPEDQIRLANLCAKATALRTSSTAPSTGVALKRNRDRHHHGGSEFAVALHEMAATLDAPISKTLMRALGVEGAPVVGEGRVGMTQDGGGGADGWLAGALAETRRRPGSHSYERAT